MQTGENTTDPRPGDEDEETQERKVHRPVSTFTLRPAEESDEDPPPKVGPPPSPSKVGPPPT